jgi:hypothetical protein
LASNEGLAAIKVFLKATALLNYSRIGRSGTGLAGKGALTLSLIAASTEKAVFSSSRRSFLVTLDAIFRSVEISQRVID